MSQGHIKTTGNFISCRETNVVLCLLGHKPMCVSAPPAQVTGGLSVALDTAWHHTHSKNVLVF